MMTEIRSAPAAVRGQHVASAVVMLLCCYVVVLLCCCVVMLLCCCVVMLLCCCVFVLSAETLRKVKTSFNSFPGKDEVQRQSSFEKL